MPFFLKFALGANNCGLRKAHGPEYVLCQPAEVGNENNNNNEVLNSNITQLSLPL